MLETAEPKRVLPRELRPEEKDLCRVVDPQQQRDNGSGGAKAGGHRAVAKVKANRILAEAEQCCRDKGASPYVSPSQRYVGQHLVDYCKQTGDHAE